MILWLLYYLLAAIAIWFGIQSLLSGFRYVKYVRRETAKPLPYYTPFVSIIAPGRGLEPGLADNVSGLLAQDYPAFEILFVFDNPSDAAIELVSDLKRYHPHVTARIVIAGPATDRGQKVHNLSVATAQVDSQSEVLAFVDTDARPGADWLRRLVAPLIDEGLGASSGYRWFIPVRGGFASRLRSIWNASIASALGGDTRKNFCWGGSTAVRKSVFDRLQIRERWRGSVSDDFSVTRVLHEASLPIHFNPNCLVPSVGDCDWLELLEFTTRQIKITRVYAPHLWKGVLLGGFMFCLTFFGGIGLLVWQTLSGRSFIILLVILLLIYLLGAGKSFIRWRAVRIPLSDYRRLLNRDLVGQLVLWPLASMLYLYNAIVAGFSRRIVWRGITYELKSPNETVIISRSD
ncbi:MAG TPA: glycosyltransferase family 2 protein [Pyrinomonadaceae bacterium]|nr:glycosyltransferase family 2 protein [Pyrinomonadaceae bacterium]